MCLNKLQKKRKDVVLFTKWGCMHTTLRACHIYLTNKMKNWNQYLRKLKKVKIDRYPNIEEEMVEMLQIAMTCVARMPEQRPKIADVARMIQEVKQSYSETRLSVEEAGPSASS